MGNRELIEHICRMRLARHNKSDHGQQLGVSQFRWRAGK